MDKPLASPPYGHCSTPKAFAGGLSFCLTSEDQCKSMAELELGLPVIGSGLVDKPLACPPYGALRESNGVCGKVVLLLDQRGLGAGQWPSWNSPSRN